MTATSSPDADDRPAGSASDRSGAIEAPLEHAGVAGLWALFIGLALLMVGNGLNGAVIGVRSGIEGFGVVTTGVIMAGYFVGFLIAPLAVVRMIPSVGHIRVFAGLASTASSVVLVHSVSADPVVWTVMRFAFGFCAAGLYVVIESWLNEMSSPSTRGRTLAIYMIVSMGGLGVGQVLLAVADPGGYRLFVLSSVLVSMSLVPMTLAATTRTPPVRLPEPMSVRDLLANVPTGVVAALASGVGVGVLLGLGAVYASRVGMSAGRTGLFIAAPTIGAIALQMPIGRLSDRVSRRLVILGDAVALLVVALALVALPADHRLELPLMFLLGGLLFPLYSLAVSYTLDWTPVHRTVSASGALVRINGAGAIAGPLVAAALMSSFGADWFFWTIIAAVVVVVAFVLVRIVIADPLPMERQRRFVNLPARASQFVLRLAPHSRRARQKPRPH